MDEVVQPDDLRPVYEYRRSRFTMNVAAQRAGLALSILTALLAFAVRVSAQMPDLSQTAASRPATVSMAHVPFAVGEELVYHATFGVLPAGTARMRVQGIDTVRGRPAYHVVFAIDGGIPFFRVHDRYESWIDVETLSSLRHTQSISEGRYHRTTTYELYPDLAEYQKNDEPIQPSVSAPLDDGSFIYAVRIAALHPGDTVRNERYFKRDKNPVVLIGLRTDTVTVGAGTFTTTVVRPSIKTNGIFSDHGDALVWFTNDERRVPVQFKTNFSRFSLTLALQSLTVGTLASR
ncbi:MAG: DUF3108 domain-containing protein [Gemmatimonadaceae bacterium]